MSEKPVFRGIPPQPVPDDTLRKEVERKFAQEVDAALDRLRRTLASFARQENVDAATAGIYKRQKRSRRIDFFACRAAKEIFEAESRYSAACLQFLADRPGYAIECRTAGDAIMRLAASAVRGIVSDANVSDRHAPSSLASAALPAGAPDISGLDLGKFQRYL